MVRAGSGGEDQGRACKRRRKAALTTRCRLPSVVPHSPYIDSVKESDITIAVSKEGVEISGGLNNKEEVNSNKKE